MKKVKERLKSIRVRLFLIFCVVIMFLVLCLITINSLVMGNFYMYSKTNTIKEVYQKINTYYAEPKLEINLERELKKIASKNNFDILIKTETDLVVFSTDKDFLDSLNRIREMLEMQQEDNTMNVIYVDENMQIRKMTDNVNNLNYIVLIGKLVNDYDLYIRIPIAPIEESVKISNEVLFCIGILTVVIASFVASFISRKFTNPILQLSEITNQMAKLDFSKKYRLTDSDDEINQLGKNINIMSDKLESTIEQLRQNNRALEKDIEEKSKIDEMRKQFISDVSHELKTPIALIQGYAEGLVENVNTDEESKKFYAEVILDESNKMDQLVKKLLQLMKLEYEKREFNNKKFDLVELIKEVIRKCDVMLQENKIEVIFNQEEPVYVYADDFYIDQVVTNYFTNAIKHAEIVNNGEKHKEGIIKRVDSEIRNKRSNENKKQIKIRIEENGEKARVFVFNTGKRIPEDDIDKIWGRFYKVDSSRNREDGGTGIGLALVKAIQNNYKNEYGVENKENGVEFFFDINLFK